MKLVAMNVKTYCAEYGRHPDGDWDVKTGTINRRLVAIVNLTHQSIAKPSETNKVQVIYSSNGLFRLPLYLVISLFSISGLFLSP